MRILIIDDEAIVHQTWRRVVRGTLVELLSAYTLEQAEQVMEQEGESIDGIILDLQLDPGCGFDLVPLARKRCPRARIRLVSAHVNMEVDVAAHALGLRATLKGGSLETMGEVLSQLTAGRYSVRIAYPTLSEREVEVVEHAMDRHKPWRVAQALEITPSTLKTHWDRIQKKTRLTRDELLRELSRRLDDRLS